MTEEIIAAGARLGDLDLLPSPFPIEDLLNERELRHVKRLYGIGGLSYGNLSQRKDERRFWMSASGVDKSNLETPGRDILLVSNYDQARREDRPQRAARGRAAARVSVDAIEHWMIYQAHPGVGAILHVHAWMQDIPATDVNYPCGTEELAIERRRPARRRAEPERGRDRPPQPRHHRHRAEPDGDPGPDRAEDPAPGADDVAPRPERVFPQGRSGSLLTTRREPARDHGGDGVGVPIRRRPFHLRPRAHDRRLEHGCRGADRDPGLRGDRQAVLGGARRDRRRAARWSATPAAPAPASPRKAGRCARSAC